MTNDLVYADSALAKLFGLRSEEAKCGLPLRAYLDRVHPDGRPHLTKTISDSVAEGCAQRSVYRELMQNGNFVSVVAFGRCFHDREGGAVLFSSYGGKWVTRPIRRRDGQGSSFRRHRR
ncbi:PAS domain-containing protein [Ensifer sp. SL37]|nr:PAS domain-containing protein [Ensifer sp. SL37]